MGMYSSIFSISLFLLSITYIVGAGAGDIVDYQSVDQDLNLTEDELTVDLRNYQSASFTYYDQSKEGITVNETEFNQSAGLLDTPSVSYGSQPNAEQVFVNVEYPANFTDKIRLCLNIGCAPIDEGGSYFDYNGQDIRVSWTNTGGYEVVSNDHVLKEIRLVEDPSNIDRGFLQNLSALLQVSTGYDFISEVLLVAISFVLGAILITLGARLLPFV